MIVESMERSRPRHRPVLPALARTPGRARDPKWLIPFLSCLRCVPDYRGTTSARTGLAVKAHLEFSGRSMRQLTPASFV
jgi:hypothetical protein